MDAFKGCDQLTTIIVPFDYDPLGRQAFHECTQLTSIIVPFQDLPTSLGSSQGFLCAYRRLMGAIRNAGARHLKNLIVSRPLTCPETVALDLISTTDARKLLEIREKEYNIARSLHLVMLMLSKNLGAACFSRYRILILVYWFRGRRRFPLDMRSLLPANSPSSS